MYLIRVSTVSNLGKGHINRCLKIRKTINSDFIWFVDKGTKRNLSKILKDEIVEEKNRSSLIKTQQYSIDHKVKCIIIDNPEIKNLKKKAIANKKPVVMLVDKYFRMKNVLSICMHPIDINKKNFLSGFQYIPFIKKKQKKSTRNKIKNILVSFGNIDSKGFTEKVIKILQELTINGELDENLYRVNIILGKHKKNKTFIRKMTSNYKNFTIFNNLNSLDKIYIDSDFAIGAPGFSQVERVEYGIPTILIAQNQTQKKLLTAWKESGCALIVKSIKRDLRPMVSLMVESNQVKDNIKKIISQKFDGDGIYRILKKIESYISDYNN